MVGNRPSTSRARCDQVVQTVDATGQAGGRPAPAHVGHPRLQGRVARQRSVGGGPGPHLVADPAVRRPISLPVLQGTTDRDHLVDQPDLRRAPTQEGVEAIGADPQRLPLGHHQAEQPADRLPGGGVEVTQHQRAGREGGPVALQAAACGSPQRGEPGPGQRSPGRGAPVVLAHGPPCPSSWCSAPPSQRSESTLTPSSGGRRSRSWMATAGTSA